MAPKKKQKEKRGDFQGTIQDLGLSGDYAWLIHQAVANQWTQAEFETALVNSKPFRRQFPGLMDKDGTFSRGLTALGVNSLGSAIQAYNRITAQYQGIARNFGKLDLGREVFGAAIRAGISPDELGRRLAVMEQVKTTQPFRDAFNQELKVAGMQPLDDLGWRKFLAGASDRKFYDVYEAATLNQRLGFEPGTAYRIARTAVGGVGQPGDLNQIISQVQQIMPDIGPELQNAGISKEDIAVLAGGTDPKGIAPTLQQILANRRALGSAGYGYQARKGLGGGVSTDTYEAQSY